MKGLLVVTAALLLVLHHLLFFYGYLGYDDLHYAELADALNRGQFDLANPFSYRVVPLALTALSYRIFGIVDTASSLPALLATGGILYGFYYVFRDRPPWMLALALLFYFGMKWNVFYSDKLMTDQFVSAFGFGAWVAYWRCRHAGNQCTTALLAAVCLFLAFNSKGTLILLVPLFATYCLYDLGRGRRWEHWATLAGALLLLLVGYFTLFYFRSGDPLVRFRAIEATHYLNACSFDQLGPEVLFDRLTRGFWFLLMDGGLLVHAVIAVGLLVVLAYQKQLRTAAAFYPLTVVLCLLSINFMTISLTSYNPVCKDPRHILMFSPILSICSVFSVRSLYRLLEWPTDWRLLPILLLAVGLLYPTVKLVRYGPTLGYTGVSEALTRLVEQAPRPAVFYGSEVTKNLANYTSDFRGPETGLHFRNLNELPSCPHPSGDTTRYLLLNWYGDWHAQTDRETLIDQLAATHHQLGRSIDRFSQHAPHSLPPLEIYPLTCP